MGKSKEAPTIRDVAKVCGLSHTVVSRALRNAYGVAPATRERVLKVAEEIGYRPDPMVSILLRRVRRGRTNRRLAGMAWINTRKSETWYQTSDFDRPVWEGARRRAEQLGFELYPFWLHPQGYEGARLHQILMARGIHGLVLPDIQPYSQRAMRGLDLAQFTCALVGWAWPDAGLTRAVPDYHGNLGLALESLDGKGYKRIGLYCYRGMDAFNSNHLLLGHFYHHFHGRRPRERVPILMTDTQLPDCHEQVARWLDKHEPEVVVCHDSRLLDAIQRTGRRVPEDVGLVHLNLAPDVHDWAGVDALLPAIGAAAVDGVYSQLSRNERGFPEYPKIVTTRGRWRDGRTLSLAAGGRGGK